MAVQPSLGFKHYGTVSHGCVETNPRPETSMGSCEDLEKLEIFANTLASTLKTFLCDEWKIGAPSILNESHLCVVFKTAVSLWVLPLKYS